MDTLRKKRKLVLKQQNGYLHAGFGGSAWKLELGISYADADVLCHREMWIKKQT